MQLISELERNWPVFVSLTYHPDFLNTEIQKWKTFSSATEHKKNPNKELKHYEVSFKFLHFMPGRTANLQL